MAVGEQRVVRGGEASCPRAYLNADEAIAEGLSGKEPGEGSGPG